MIRSVGRGFEPHGVRNVFSFPCGPIVGIIWDIYTFYLLQGKAEETYKDMDEWLGQRFLQEVER